MRGVGSAGLYFLAAWLRPGPARSGGGGGGGGGGRGGPRLKLAQADSLFSTVRAIVSMGPGPSTAHDHDGALHSTESELLVGLAKNFRAADGRICYFR